MKAGTEFGQDYEKAKLSSANSGKFQHNIRHTKMNSTPGRFHNAA